MENPVIAFGIEYGGEMMFCEAVMHARHYEITFNGEWIASIQHTDELNWIQESGIILPDDIVQEIGERIESYYQ